VSIIGHLDLDAFFAAVEERDRPELRGQPLVVGADPEGGRGRGVVSTANYAARRYGIHSAMPISRAWKLSEAARRRGEPPVVFVPPRLSRYAEVSARVMAIVRRHVPLVEEAGIDEAYLDLSFAGNFAAAREICPEARRPDGGHPGGSRGLSGPPAGAPNPGHRPQDRAVPGRPRHHPG